MTNTAKPTYNELQAKLAKLIEASKQSHKVIGQELSLPSNLHSVLVGAEDLLARSYVNDSDLRNLERIPTESTLVHRIWPSSGAGGYTDSTEQSLNRLSMAGYITFPQGERGYRVKRIA